MMGRYSQGLQEMAEHCESQVCNAIRGLNEEGLVEFCRDLIKNYKDFAKDWKINFESVISNSVTPKEQLSMKQLAREDQIWREAWIQIVKSRRKSREPIPEWWRDFLLDQYLGIEETPDMRGKHGDETLRDQAICRCIWYIQKATKFKASRNEATKNAPCGISIVVEALNGKTGYAGVERVWKNRDKSVWPV